MPNAVLPAEQGNILIALRQKGFRANDRSIDMATKHFPKGLDGRMRDENGEIRQKRSDTKVETLRKTYGDDFAKGYRSDTKLGTVLKREGVETLDQLVKKDK
jgi:hypothetical protein